MRPRGPQFGAGIHGKFTGSSTLPAVTVSLGAVLVVPVAPVTAGDALAAGEDVSVQPTGDLPGGMNIAWWWVSAANTVRIGLSTTVAIAAGTSSIGWRVTAHR